MADSQWEKPDGFQGESSDFAQSEQTEVSSFVGFFWLSYMKLTLFKISIIFC